MPLGQLFELFQQIQFLEDPQGRGMHRIATEITQEIAMLFQDSHRDARTRQQQCQHHAGRAASDDTTSGAIRGVRAQ